MRLTAAAIVFLAATAAVAQVRESVTVQVVEVPVYVTSNGSPVTNLTRDNFRLFVNGKPQAIDYFDQIDFAALSPEQMRDPRQRRLYMLVFDLNVSLNQLHRAQRAAVKLIDDAAENHTFAVASLGGGRLDVIVPFTRDAIALRHAIRELQVSKTGDPLRLALTPGERGGEMGRPDVIDDPRFTIAGQPFLDELAMIQDEVYQLGDLATRLSGMEGVKHVVLMSSGFDAVALHGIQSPPARGDLRTGPMRSLRDLDRPMYSSALMASPNAALLTQIRYMVDRYAKAGVFLDAIDTAGLRPMQTLYDNESLTALTRDTGGTLIDRRNDLTGAIQSLIDRQRVVYVLGFRPTETRAEVNTIKVKLAGAPRGLQVSYRPSFSATGETADTADHLRLADIVMNDIPQNGVTTAAHVEVAPASATVEMDIPGPEVLAHAILDTVGAEAMFYVVSGSSVVAFRTKRITVDVQRAGAGLAQAPLRVRETFDLPPGQYAAKVLVRMDGSGALGFARADFKVGE